MLPSPPTPFSFTAPGQIIFGNGSINSLPEKAGNIGHNVCVICGKNRNRIQPIIDTLQGHISYLQVDGEPTLKDIKNGIRQVRLKKCDLVIGIGGGSVIDTGKAIATLLTNPGDPLDYLEIIGLGKALVNPPLPFIAIPTTSGTGAEATANAVIGSLEHQVKVSLRSPMMIPDVVIVDPELTRSVPPEITAATGMDALTQVLEPYVSHLATPITDLLCKDGLARAAHSLEKAYDNGNDMQAREDMALCSLYGGLALANAKLGAVHGIAGPFGGMFSSPHGAVCAVLLPHVMQINILALQKQDPQNCILTRYREIAILLTGDTKADSMDGADTISKLIKKFNLPGLSHYGLTEVTIDELIDKSSKASSMKGNPVTLSRQELRTIITSAM